MWGLSMYVLHLPVFSITYFWIVDSSLPLTLEALPLATASLCQTLIFRFALGSILSASLLLGISMTRDHLAFPLLL